MVRTSDSRGERELVTAAQSGDAGAREALFARFEASIYRFGLHMCRDTEDARDVLQETLLAATRTLDGFRGDAAVGTWLFQIARSFCIKMRRRRGRQQAVDLDDTMEVELGGVPDPGALPDEVAIDKQVGAALRRAIGRLPATNREVIVLRDVEGLSAPEVATTLGISVDAVKSRLHRARMAIRGEIAPLLGLAAETLAPPSSASGCPDVLGLYSRKLEGEIDGSLCAEMERHVAGCTRCASACDSLRKTLTICRASQSARVPPRVQEKVRRALHDLIYVEQ